jgi:hypothetical protein
MGVSLLTAWRNGALVSGNAPHFPRTRTRPMTAHRQTYGVTEVVCGLFR